MNYSTFSGFDFEEDVLLKEATTIDQQELIVIMTITIHLTGLSTVLWILRHTAEQAENSLILLQSRQGTVKIGLPTALSHLKPLIQGLLHRTKPVPDDLPMQHFLPDLKLQKHRPAAAPMPTWWWKKNGMTDRSDEPWPAMDLTRDRFRVRPWEKLHIASTPATRTSNSQCIGVQRERDREDRHPSWLPVNILTYTKCFSGRERHSLKSDHSGVMIGGLYGVLTEVSLSAKACFPDVSTPANTPLSWVCNFMHELGTEVIDCQMHLSIWRAWVPFLYTDHFIIWNGMEMSMEGRKIPRVHEGIMQDEFPTHGRLSIR